MLYKSKKMLTCSRAGLRRVVALVVEARVMAEMALSPHKCAAPTAQHDTGRCAVELETKARYDFTITEKAPTRVFSWLNQPARPL